VAAGRGSGGRGVCKRGQRRGEIGPGQGRVTRGGRPSRRWSGSGGTAAPGELYCAGGRGGRAGEQRMPEEEEGRGGGSEGLMCKTRKSRDLSVK
jgi:hypothetical protein